MNEISQEYIKSLFDYKDGFLYWKVSLNRSIKIGSKAGGLHHTGYYNIGINGKGYGLHRLIFLYHHGYLPKYLDHIDGNKSNNQIENLREVTSQQNNMNRNPNKNSLSIYKGVQLHKPTQKWVARIKINGKVKHLGYFNNEIDAAKAYNKDAIKLFGEFANLNIIRGD